MHIITRSTCQVHQASTNGYNLVEKIMGFRVHDTWKGDRPSWSLLDMWCSRTWPSSFHNPSVWSHYTWSDYRVDRLQVSCNLFLVPHGYHSCPLHSMCRSCKFYKAIHLFFLLYVISPPGLSPYLFYIPIWFSCKCTYHSYPYIIWVSSSTII